ncbi:MAG: hypothetical protein RLZZ381_88 [Cyanobacteriota bacterium]|jgi:hypothetical protein
MTNDNNESLTQKLISVLKTGRNITLLQNPQNERSPPV